MVHFGKLVPFLFFGCLFLFTALYAQHQNPAAPETISWFTLGSGTEGVNNRVHAITSYRGQIIVAGQFTTAGGITANRIAAWNGTTWSPLGTGMDNTVRALAVMGGSLYAGGDFLTAGGIAANRIARWTGTEWQPLGEGVNNSVYTLAVLGDSLFAGGSFTGAGGMTAQNFAKWSGGQWSVPPGFNDIVFTLAVHKNRIYAGGRFTQSGTTPLGYISQREGSTWLPLGGGTNNFVQALSSENDTLYVGGNFTMAGSVSAGYVARWANGNWSSPGSGVNDFVFALSAVGGDLFAAGQFTSAGSVSSNRLAKWHNGTWEPVNSGLNNTVYALYADGASSSMYMGGTFTSAGGLQASRIIRFTDSENPLPVELLSFTGTFDGYNITLRWTTASELNNKEFEVQHFEDGTWHTSAALPGAGTSTVQQDYIYRTVQPAGVVSLRFRLLQKDFSGSTMFSPEITVELNSSPGYHMLSIYPNPFNPAAVVRYEVKKESETRVEVYDVTGRLMKTLISGIVPAGKYSVSLNGAELSAGVYIVRFVSEGTHQALPVMLLK